VLLALSSDPYCTRSERGPNQIDQSRVPIWRRGRESSLVARGNTKAPLLATGARKNSHRLADCAPLKWDVGQSTKPNFELIAAIAGIVFATSSAAVVLRSDRQRSAPLTAHWPAARPLNSARGRNDQARSWNTRAVVVDPVMPTVKEILVVLVPVP
jgi:hypothetical protein